jgi:hypothetical protein
MITRGQVYVTVGWMVSVLKAAVHYGSGCFSWLVYRSTVVKKQETILPLSFVDFPWWPPLIFDQHRYPQQLSFYVECCPRAKFFPNPKTSPIWLPSWRMRQILLENWWTMILPLDGLVFCFRDPVTYPHFITCYDFWEKCFWLPFIKSKILLRKCDPSLLLKCSQHSRNTARTGLRHVQVIMVDG